MMNMEFPNFERIIGLKNKIINALVPLIEKDYVLLDFPNYPNIGDCLIWKGELDFLSTYVPYKKLYSANHYAVRFDKIPQKSVILCSGGGNFGDIYTECQALRLAVAQQFKDSRIIILPQTVFYKDQNLLRKHTGILNSHPDLYICVRDLTSFNTLANFMNPDKLFLLPDMAFCLNLQKDITGLKTGKTLMMQRIDAELNMSYSLKQVLETIKGKVDILDWPTYNYGNLISNLLGSVTSIEKRLSRNLIKVPVLNNIVSSEYGLKSRGSFDKHIRTGIDFINQYDRVFTTRLHGLILSILLNKEVILLDNSYGKNLNFYNAWLKDFQGVRLFDAKSSFEINNIQ